MQYIRLGDSGLVVSRLALGAMTFGSGDIPGIYKVDQNGADNLVSRALDAGVTLFDTADVYASGQSEEILGRALGSRRQDVVLATKVGLRTGAPLTASGLSRRHILWSIDASLRRLRTDWIDLYIAHRPDPFVPLEETLSALDDVVRSGKARYIGFSNWPAWMAAKAIGIQRRNGLAQFVNGQMYYSLVGRDIEAEVLPFAIDSGVGITVWSPLASGFLSGKYTPQDPNGDNGRISQIDFIPFDREKGFKIVDVVRDIAEQHNASAASVAIAWLLNRRGISAVLVGATTRQQLDGNVQAAQVKLTADNMARLDAISKPHPSYPSWYNASGGDQVLEAAFSKTPQG